MNQKQRNIYLDYSASTPLDPRVEAVMRPYQSERFGNASSAHAQGQAAEYAIEDARERAAQLLNCRPAEIVFTSGGTESDNLALRGAGLAIRRQTGRSRIVTTRVEHSAVSKTAEQMAEWLGFEAAFVPVDACGRAGVEAVEAAAVGAALSLSKRLRMESLSDDRSTSTPTAGPSPLKKSVDGWRVFRKIVD